MSKLDRFLVTDSFISLFPSISVVCLDRHLSDHRPILLREVKLDYGLTPFWLYHSWFSLDGFDDMVEQSWRSFSHVDSNDELQDIDKELDRSGVSDSLILRRHELKCQLNDIKIMEAKDSLQKSKVRWAIQGDENSKFFHGIINKKTFSFSDSWLLHDQAEELERSVSRDEIRLAVWDCGENKSPVKFIPQSKMQITKKVQQNTKGLHHKIPNKTTPLALSLCPLDQSSSSNAYPWSTPSCKQGQPQPSGEVFLMTWMAQALVLDSVMPRLETIKEYQEDMVNEVCSITPKPKEGMLMLHWYDDSPPGLEGLSLEETFGADDLDPHIDLNRPAYVSDE
ncbi:LINE-1 reverse transcriptase isogeny [Artemisia annua]|uniref:LINE-1 reverse transcriptase isogeny n=1 Tax=Artemisia annua TaxID=35608 RepID=A0A2U1MUJ3_ARTAN|nr:LINE-1 reverse transcriptase isogeny [Artemisia annua]